MAFNVICKWIPLMNIWKYERDHVIYNKYFGEISNQSTSSRRVLLMEPIVSDEQEIPNMLRNPEIY
jgi:hypothetical protein